MTGRFGHFGWPALVLAAGGLAALILHLTVPYAHLDESARDALDGYGKTLDRGETAELHDDADLVGLSAPGWTLAGTIVLAVAGLGLLGAGFLPMSVDTARWIGWGTSAVATIGGMMALISSLLWVGSGLGLPPGNLTGGLTGLVELVFGTDNLGTVVVIGPVLVTLTAGASVWSALSVCANVSTMENGVRERARRHLAGSRIALLLLALALVVPWSIGEGPDHSGGDDTDYYALGAHTILNTEELTGGELWGGMAYTLHVIIATAWVGVFAGIVGSVGGVLASTGANPSMARATHWTIAPAAFMLLWTLILYVLAWSYMWRPHEDIEGFQPGYFPALLLAPLVLWTLQQARIVRVILARSPAARGSGKPVAFD